MDDQHGRILTPTFYVPEAPLKLSRGWTKLDNRIVDRMPDMGPAAWAVYCQLARHGDRYGHCFPSIRRLAKLTTLDPKTVGAALKKLVAMKLVRTQKAHGKVTQYWLQRCGNGSHGTVGMVPT
jgi:hypothetical protein